MLDKNRTYRFVIDKVTKKPACVLLQALYGGDREPCFVFQDWEINLSPNFIGVTMTGAEIEKFAAINAGRQP
jgi:hypothetical protein